MPPSSPMARTGGQVLRESRTYPAVSASERDFCCLVLGAMPVSAALSQMGASTVREKYPRRRNSTIPLSRSGKRMTVAAQAMRMTR